jgi:hypothetical protein
MCGATPAWALASQGATDMARATPDATAMRRCIGSRTFGIEAHEAPAGEFPIQPSGKDGLGRMCKSHWKAYTTALRKAALARKAADGAAIPVESAQAASSRRRGKPPREAPVGGRTARAPKPMSAKVRDAKAVIAATETPAGEAYTDAAGGDEVRSAPAVPGSRDGAPDGRWRGSGGGRRHRVAQPS